MAISIWYISFLQHLLGLAPATLNIQASPPLRSRSSPLGLSSLSPDENEKINKANRALEVAVWVAEQALQYPSKIICLNIIFFEDLGGHCLLGPSSTWVLRECRFLEGIRDARRAAAYMCQFTRSEYKRPIGILSNCTCLRPLVFLGWPNLVEVQNCLKYKGPLPLSCSCGREHTPLIGFTDDATFRTSSSVGFGAEFWISCVCDDMLERSFVSLGDGDRPDLTPLGDSPLLSPSLASASTSLRSSYEAWKAGTLTKASLVDIAPSGSIASYFSAPPRSSLGSSSRSCLCSLWKVFPVSSTVVLPGGSSACTTPGSLSARCVVFTVSPCLIIFPLFSRPLIIDPAGRTVLAGSNWGCYAGWTMVFWLVRSLLCQWLQLLVRVFLGTCS